MKPFITSIILSLVFNLSYSQFRIGYKPYELRKEFKPLELKDSTDFYDHHFLKMNTADGSFLYIFDYYDISIATEYYPTPEILQYYKDLYNSSATVVDETSWIIKADYGVQISVKLKKNSKGKEYLYYTEIKK